jgi:hypothetical protein
MLVMILESVSADDMHQLINTPRSEPSAEYRGWRDTLG